MTRNDRRHPMGLVLPCIPSDFTLQHVLWLLRQDLRGTYLPIDALVWPPASHTHGDVARSMFTRLIAVARHLERATDGRTG